VAGLLSPRMLLVHYIFLIHNNWEIIIKITLLLLTTHFRTFCLLMQQLFVNNLKLDLGSDIAVSPYPSIFRACFDAVTHSRVKENGSYHTLSGKERLTEGEAYWMASAGGTKTSGLHTGAIIDGKLSDAVCVKTTNE